MKPMQQRLARLEQQAQHTGQPDPFAPRVFDARIPTMTSEVEPVSEPSNKPPYKVYIRSATFDPDNL